MSSLHKKTSTAVIWSAFDVFMRQGVQFIITIILARILSPEDFGIIAMLGLFVGISGVFIDGGFSSALIQRQNVTRIDESTVFFFNLGMAAIAALILCISATWIANFFEHTVLEYLTYAMAFNLLLNAFGAIHATLLSKELNFKTIAKVSAVSSSLSGALAIYLAISGFGVWSMVWQGLAASIIWVMLLWFWHPWRPVWMFSFASLRRLFRFGGYEMAATLTDVISNNLYLVMIGKLFSLRDVGLYDRAQKTQRMPVMLMMGIVDRVAYSAFSAVASDKDKLVRGLRKAQATSMFINVPVLVAVIILAEPLVLTLFGPKWLSCAPILQVLALAGLLWPLHLLNLSVLKAQGRADLFFWITILKKTVAIGLTVFASFYGVMAIAWAQVFASLFAYIINAHYSKVFLGYGVLKQLRDLTLNFIAVIPMAVTVYVITSTMQFSAPIELLIASIIGGFVYLISCWLICAEVLYEFLNLAGFQIKANQSSKEIAL